MKDNEYQLSAISPIEGRYFSQSEKLREYFSEYALNKTRVEIEIKYLLFLSKNKIVPKVLPKDETSLKKIYQNFNLEDCAEVKTIESKTRHDVKAVEYFLQDKFDKNDIQGLSQWIHFGLTSNDINDNAYRLMVKRAVKTVINPILNDVSQQLLSISDSYKDTPMLARTHGQAAVPTTFGKEIKVFYDRTDKEINTLEKQNYYGKLGGAVGNMNALVLAFPNIDWLSLSQKFLASLGLRQSKVVTQIAPPEDLINVFQNITRLNSIYLDLCQDMWRYISDDWIYQKGKESYVGSSTMPQKINPIEFENAEGNIVMANGIFEIFARKLPVSRLQRDLSDSTVLRNIGVAFAHSLIAYQSLIKGLNTIAPNKETMLSELNQNWNILSEAIQTLLRKEGNSKAYDIVAEHFRGKKISQKDWVKIVTKLPLEKSDKKKLLELTPEKYLGYAEKL
jgi:adenylosuccinate lyase